MNETFQVGDHDFSRGSLIPSVTMRIDIPDSSSESFYSGQVHVALKDAVFQASNPFRHAAEFSNVVGEGCPPIAILYTDGGPDHRCNYLSVMYSMISLFLSHDLDCLILARNAPGHSWRNPAERIMSLLNLGLQTVGVMRQETGLETDITK